MSAPASDDPAPGARTIIRVFLSGDVMTGRGIDQILSHPCDPILHEHYMDSAAGYVALAEAANGPIPRPAAPDYIWGDALGEWQRAKPDVRIVNLETAVTRSDDWADKGINYRMSPENAGCLDAAGIDCCVLANNHVLDWGHAGLDETLGVLARHHLAVAGAGRTRAEARAPAVLDVAGRGRVIVVSMGAITSGIPGDWRAGETRSGVNLIDLSDADIDAVADDLGAIRRPGDVVIASIHWGSNWGYAVPRAQRQFAHDLIDRAGVAIVHGHSAHHPKPIEVYRGRLILYGCGDFINDYEGIEGYEDFRDDLTLMYFADIDAARGDLVALEMVPMQIRRFRLQRAVPADAAWLRERLTRECAPFGTRLELAPDGRLRLRWNGARP